MTRYLRMVRQGRWDRPRWLADTASEWQGDALSDLVTGKNALSVYQADSDEMIDLAVATLASNRDSLCNLDYTLIDDVLISRMDIHLRQVDSTTPHTAGNKLHWDIEHLTAANIFTLMQSITADTVTRVKWKRVREMLQCAIKDGHIDPCNLSSGIKKSCSCSRIRTNFERTRYNGFSRVLSSGKKSLYSIPSQKATANLIAHRGQCRSSAPPKVASPNTAWP